MFSHEMTLVVAAMREELQAAVRLFPRASHRGALRGPRTAHTRSGRTITFARLGMGPGRSAPRLAALLDDLRPEQVLCIGYAGALDPSLRAGELVVVDRAIELDDGSARKAPLEDLRAVGSFTLAQAAELEASAARAAVQARRGTALTSTHLIGDPAQKQALFERFGACVIDMETAALARVCESRSVPLCCVRAVSDEAVDGFLAPLRYDPRAGALRQSAALVGAGDWVRRLRAWRIRSAEARRALSSFLSFHLLGETP